MSSCGLYLWGQLADEGVSILDENSQHGSKKANPGTSKAKAIHACSASSPTSLLVGPKQKMSPLSCTSDTSLTYLGNHPACTKPKMAIGWYLAQRVCTFTDGQFANQEH